MRVLLYPAPGAIIRAQAWCCRELAEDREIRLISHSKNWEPNMEVSTVSLCHVKTRALDDNQYKPYKYCPYCGQEVIVEIDDGREDKKEP